MGRSRIRRKKEQERAEDDDSVEISEPGDEEAVEKAKRGSSRSGRRSSRSRQRRAAPSKGNKSNNPVIRYFQETSDELQKVKWPTQEEALRLTGICLAVLVVSTIFLGGLDFIAQEIVLFALGGG